MAKKPNILWFVADQLRADAIHHLGNPASHTPNIDQLAGDGVSFENAYCQNPVCVPSRCSFLTGLYPHTLGHRTMHFMMQKEDPNILKTMKQNGYEVVWIGRNDFIPSSWAKTDYCDRFYDGADLVEKSAVEGGSMHFARPDVTPEIAPVMEGANLKYSFYQGKFPEHSMDQSFDWNNVNCALNYLKERSEQPGEKPFFLYCTLSFPHPPYGCEEPWYSMIDRKSLPPRRPDIETLSNKASILYNIREKQGMQDWTEEQYNEIRAVYLGMTARFDYQLGLLMEQLKKGGLYDDTSVFVFSDHGDFTCDYGIAEKCQNSYEDTLTNVPLIVKPAKDIPVKQGVNAALVQLNDLPATVYEMTGVEPGYNHFGKSLSETLATGCGHRDAVFCEGGRLHGEPQAMEPNHGPESPYWPRISTQHEEGSAHTKGCMIRMGNLKYVMRLYESDELYDLQKDPMETQNLINDPAYAADVASLKNRMLQFYMETCDYVPPVMDKR
ncbi:MAG: sulfatase-like hydrolase/transferase [Lachnospiraceae bacterium]|nr:sulfatase-like hydrolase/transferase [Lachnospiraceae bacterium]